jgi:hypothetical protein
MNQKSNCCGASMTDIDQDGIGLCSECKEWAWDEEEQDEDDNILDEDVNYEAAKDLEESRWQGVTAACRR